MSTVRNTITMIMTRDVFPLFARGAILAPLGLVLCLCVGCNRPVMVSGEVRDVRGAALPGVAVTVLGAPYQATTTGTGEYMLRTEAGSTILEYIKTGYTPGRLELAPNDTATEGYNLRMVQVRPVTLWPLPPGRGVYYFRGFREETTRKRARYISFTPTTPERYLRENGDRVFGTRMTPEFDILEALPFVVAHRVPNYDLKLYRLEEAPVALAHEGSEDPAYTERAWLPATSIPVLPVPVDEEEQLLVELQLVAPLSPGVYAVHWGALDGYFSTDARAYLFRIVDPNAPPPAEGEPEGELAEGEAPGGE